MNFKKKINIWADGYLALPPWLPFHGKKFIQVDTARCHASHPASCWRNLIRQPVKRDLCTPFLLANFITASQILPCCCCWTFSINSGRDTCLQSSLSLNRKYYKPCNIVAEQNYRKLKKRRTLEHRQGHRECCFWEGRECDVLVYSQELEVVCLEDSLAAWSVPLEATECFVSLCNSKLRAQVRYGFGSGLSARMPCPRCLSLVALGGWRLVLHPKTEPGAVLLHRIQTPPLLEMKTSAAGGCCWREVVLHGKRKWSHQDVFQTRVPPSPYPFYQWSVIQLCHLCLSHSHSDRATAWRKPPPEPSGSLAGVGFTAWWRPCEMFQLQTNWQDKEESHAGPATRGLLNPPLPSPTLCSPSIPPDFFSGRNTPGFPFSCSSDVICRGGKKLFDSNTLKLHVPTEHVGEKIWQYLSLSAMLLVPRAQLNQIKLHYLKLILLIANFVRDLAIKIKEEKRMSAFPQKLRK